MIDWWSSLLLEKQIFYAIGLASISILLIQIVLTFIGIDTHHDAELAHGEHESGLSFLSVRTITAFFVEFGWAGVDKIIVWDSRKNAHGKTGTAVFLSGLVSALPPLHELARNAGLDLPTYLGRLQEAAQGQSSHPTRAETTEKEAPPPAKA